MIMVGLSLGGGMRALTRRWRVLAASGVLVVGVIGPAAADSGLPGLPSLGSNPITGLLDILTDNGDSNFQLGCRNNLLAATDDGSSPAVALPFAPNFFGTRHQVYVNNNGNVTFGSPRPEFHFDDLSADTANPMIAPFLADVDTRDVVHSRPVTYGVSADQKVFCADWPGVGAYNNHGDKLDKFRLLLIDRSADPGNAPGDFDIVMDYDSINWDTADAKAPNVAAVARAGFSDGTSTSNHSYQLPGSGTPGAFGDQGPHSLAEHSLVTHDQHVTSQQGGRYIFAVRGGQPLPAGQAPEVQDITLHTAQNVPLQARIPTSDGDGDAVVLRSATDGEHGKVTCGGDPTAAAVDGGPISCTYTPAENYHGTDAFSVNVTDSHANEGTGTVHVVVDAADAPPTVVSPQTMTVSAGNPPAPVTANVLAGAGDPDGDPVALSAPLSPTATAHGSVTCTAAGSCSYTPNATFTPGSTDTFTFTAIDSKGGSTFGTVNIAQHNDPPTAVFGARLQTAESSLRVAFDGSGSHDPQGPIASYAWDFGDGSSGIGVSPVHLYAEPGIYTVRLTVTDSGGLTNSVSRSVRLIGDAAPDDSTAGPAGTGNQSSDPQPRHDQPRGVERSTPNAAQPEGRDSGHSSHRRARQDRLELENGGGHGYSMRGTVRDGDYRIERVGGQIRRITGTGTFADGSSVTFNLRVRDNRAFGTIAIRDTDGRLDRFRVDGVRIVDHGSTVEGRAKYRADGSRFAFVIQDRRA
jgi:PKD repeat protein